MASTVILLDPVKGKKGVYDLPQSHGYFLDEPIESLDTMKDPSKERGKVRVGEKSRVVDVYVKTYAGIRFPYMLVSDLEGLL